ncbi:MAG: universal stress protein [Vicinamibacterales bacterium]
MIALNSILVPTDFGPPSELALVYGRHLARQFGAVLHVLHSVESVMLPGGAEVPMPAVQQVEAGLLEVGRRQMAEALTDDDRTSLKVVDVVRQAPSAAADILEYARANHIDLIVMGTHGRGALEHLLMGSVAERVVRRAPCPVLTVRATERDFVQPDTLAPVRPV